MGRLGQQPVDIEPSASPHALLVRLFVCVVSFVRDLEIKQNTSDIFGGAITTHYDEN